jgi:glycosyltransferase involved in cell wall biosynthesis
MNSPELAIIMPVYNEQASIRKVVTKWFHEIENYKSVF